MCGNSTCYSCNQPSICSQNDCSCPIKDLSTDCVLYTGADLVCSGIKSKTILTDLIQQLDEFICQILESVGGVNLINIGTGSGIYKGANLTGAKELRTIKAVGDFIEIGLSTSDNEIEIKESPIEALKKLEMSFDWKDSDNFNDIKVPTDLPYKVTDSKYKRNGFIGHIKPYENPTGQVFHPQINYDGSGFIDPILLEADIFNLGIKIKDFDKIKDYSPVVVISKYLPTKKHTTQNPMPIPNTSNPIEYFPNTTYKKGSFKFSSDNDNIRLTRVPIQAQYQVIDFGQEHYFRTSKAFQVSKSLGGGKHEFILETRGAKNRYSQARTPYAVADAGYLGKNYSSSSAFVYLQFHIEITVNGKTYLSKPLGRLKMIASLDTPARGTKVIDNEAIVPYDYMEEYGTNTRIKIRYKHT